MSKLNTLLWGLVESVQEPGGRLEGMLDLWRWEVVSGKLLLPGLWVCLTLQCTYGLTVPQCRPFPASWNASTVCPRTAVWLLPSGLLG